MILQKCSFEHIATKVTILFYAYFLLFFLLKIIHFVPIRSAVYIYKLLRQNLPIYDKIFEKPHEKSQGKNFTSLFLSLIDLEKKNRLAYLLIWSQNHARRSRFIFFLIFVHMEGT